MAEDRMLNDEILLGLIKANSGGGGTTDYDALSNKPQIAGTTLSGNKSLADLGIASATDLAGKQNTLTFDDVPTDNSNNPVKSNGIYDALAGKEGAFVKGDYLKLTNGTLSVQKSKGDDLYDYKFVTTSTADVQPSVKIQRYINGVFQSETNYINDNVRDHPVTLDDLLTFTYGIGGYYWQYTLLENSNQHNKNDVVRWEYRTVVNYEETFDVPQQDTSKNLVLQEDLDAAISSAYHHAGTKTCAELVAGLLVAANEGNVYNMTDSGTTTADFIDGAGQPIKAGDNVGVAKISAGVYKFDLLSGFVDTTNFVQKSQTAGLLKNDGTVDTTIQGDVVSLKSGLTNLDTEVNGDATVYPYADVITIEDAVPANVADCSVKVEPVQDLHGYDKPWVGGAGKNKLPLVLADIKAANTSGTWSGNVYTINGDTIEVLVDSDNNVLGFKINKTHNVSITFNIFDNKSYVFDGSYDFVGESVLKNGEMAYTYTFDNASIDVVNSNGVTQAVDDNLNHVHIYIWSAKTYTNQIVTPMVCLSSETDKSFAPYTNYCPISGHTESVVTRTGKNLAITQNNNSVICHCLNGRTYTVSSDVTFSLLENGWGGNTFYTGSNPYTFTATKDFNLFFNGFNAPSFIQVEFGSSATEYEPFGQTYTIALGSTIYGGTVDFDSGVLTVTHKGVEYDGSVDESIGRAATGTANKYRFTLGASDAKAAESTSYIADMVANMLLPVSTAHTNACIDGIALRTGSDRGFFVFNHVFEAYTLEEFKGYLSNNPLQVCYPIATPTTIQLTPQQIQLLKGQNTLTASTGDISVTVNGVSGSIGVLTEDVTELQNGEYKVIASVTADGVKTYAALLIGLYNFVDGNKCYLSVGNTYYNFVQKSTNHAFFTTSAYFNGVTSLYNADIQINAANFVKTDIASDGTITVTNRSSEVPTNGTVIKLVR